MKTIAVATHGCKSNQYETEAILCEFIHDGYSLIDVSENPDIILINTCCVTNRAEAKSRHTIRRALEQKNSANKIIVTGCYAEANRKFLKNNSKSLYLFSNKEKPFIFDFIKTGKRKNHLIKANIQSSF